MEAFRPCLAAKLRRSGGGASAGRRPASTGTTGGPSANSVEPPPDAVPKRDSPARKDLDERATAQSLEQEQAVFERKVFVHDALFKLQLAMGWSTFVLPPATLVALLVYPPAGAGMLPLLGAAFWNWRRMLKRDEGELEAVTKPGDDAR